MSTGIFTGNVTGISVLKVSITPAEVDAVTAPAQTFTINGVKTGDAIIVNPPAQAGSVGVANAYVSAANTVSIQFVNPTAGALTPDAGTYIFTVISNEAKTLTKVVK